MNFYNLYVVIGLFLTYVLTYPYNSQTTAITASKRILYIQIPREFTVVFFRICNIAMSLRIFAELHNQDFADALKSNGKT